MTTLPPYFGIVIPGRPLITEFHAVDQTKAFTIIEQPATVPDLSFFLFPSSPIALGYGAILYYSLPPFQNWEIIGSVSPEKPSGIFHTNWTTNEEILRSGCQMLQLGVSIEP
jgi:protein Hikeshi